MIENQTRISKGAKEARTKNFSQRWRQFPTLP